MSTSQLSGPSGCTSIQDVPVAHDIEYNSAIQNLFDNYSNKNIGCIDCHFEADKNPSGGLDLTDGISYANIVDIQTGENPNYSYVVPFHPEQSFLFMKVNCDSPGVGDRMPDHNFAGGITVEQQALIYDWIANGATIETSDDIFRGNFEIRGFDQ